MEQKVIRKSFALTTENSERFKVAEFERRLSHTNKNVLKKSIMEYGLLNENFWVWNNGEGFKIFDGQTRFSALTDLLSQNFKKSFMINLIILQSDNEDAARQLYIELQKSVQIGASDILKVWDNGTIPFFDKLEKYCSHYGSKENLKYIDILRAYHYAVTSDPETLNKNELREMVTSISFDEIERIKIFLDNIREVHGDNVKQWFLKSSILRNTFRIFWECFPDCLPKLPKFLKTISEDTYLKKNNDIRTRESVLQIYEYMEKIRKKMNIEKIIEETDE